MLRLFPCPPDSFDQVFLCDSLATRKVPSSNLSINLDARVWWDEVVGDVVSFEDWDARLYNGVIFPETRDVSTNA